MCDDIENSVCACIFIHVVFDRALNYNIPEIGASFCLRTHVCTVFLKNLIFIAHNYVCCVVIVTKKNTYSYIKL